MPHSVPRTSVFQFLGRTSHLTSSQGTTCSVPVSWLKHDKIHKPVSIFYLLMIYWLWKKKSCTLHNTACSQSSGATHHNRMTIEIFTLTAENAELLVLPTDDVLMLSITTDFSLSAYSFQQFIFWWPTDPQRTQLRFSLLSLAAFFEPLGLLDVVLIARVLRLRGWCICHECTGLCRCRRILQPFFDRKQLLKNTVHRSLVVIKRLPDVAKLLVLKSYCFQDMLMQQLIGMSCNPRQPSSEFLSENCISTLAT